MHKKGASDFFPPTPNIVEPLETPLTLDFPSNIKGVGYFIKF